MTASGAIGGIAPLDVDLAALLDEVAGGPS